MVIDLSPLNSVLSIMYKDRMTVERLTNFKDPETNLTTQKYSVVPEYDNLECKVSFGSIDSATVPTENADANPYSLNPDIFYPIKYDIKKGDKLTIDIIGNKGEVLDTIRGVCGNPKAYQLFKQVELSIEEK